jgi:hypothetical protein
MRLVMNNRGVAFEEILDLQNDIQSIEVIFSRSKFFDEISPEDVTAFMLAFRLAVRDQMKIDRKIIERIELLERRQRRFRFWKK